MEEQKAEEVQELLEYPEGTAGRLMSPDFVAVLETVTVARAIEHIRKAKTGDGAFYVYVVDDHDHLVGFVPLHRLITADPATTISAIRTEDVESVTVDTDQEEVARLVQRYNLIQVPVVDANRRLLGVIGVEDVLDVIREEATEDIQRLGGVGGDENVLDPPQSVFTKRLVWRLINLGTAVLAASVIGLFEQSIQSLATLAVFMPIDCRSEEHTSELQSLAYLVCRLLLEKKKYTYTSVATVKRLCSASSSPRSQVSVARSSFGSVRTRRRSARVTVSVSLPRTLTSIVKRD